MTVGTGLRGTLVTLGVDGAITGGVLVGLPRVLPASFIALPQSPRAPSTSQPAAPAAATTAAPAPAGPTLDTVRLEPDGSGLVAGRADPGSTVEVLLGEETVAEMTADAVGNFVAFLALAPSAEPRALSLRDDDGDLSDETVILAPTGAAPEEEQVAALTTAEPPSAAGQGPTAPTETPTSTKASDPDRPTDLASSDGLGSVPALTASEAPGAESASDMSTAADAIAAPDSQVAAAAGSDAQTADTALTASNAASAEPAPDAAGAETAAPDPAADDTSITAQAAAADPALAAPTSDAPATPPVLLSDADGVRVLQPALAPDASSDVRDTVALDAITYDGSGEVVLSGRATGGGAVRLYIDNAPVADATIAPDGSWSSALGTTAAGIYTLRVDQLDEEGEVLSRIETPFQREGRDQLADAMAGTGGQPVAMRIVQPGNTLWAIARERYGEPMMYVQVFEANSERIRNPDLIYPGQIFVLPATDAP